MYVALQIHRSTGKSTDALIFWNDNKKSFKPTVHAIIWRAITGNNLQITNLIHIYNLSGQKKGDIGCYNALTLGLVSGNRCLNQEVDSQPLFLANK